MAERARVAKYARIRAQAIQLQANLPELFAYLRERDDALNRAIARLPDPADPDSTRTVACHGDLWRSLRHVPPGLRDLV